MTFPLRKGGNAEGVGVSVTGKLRKWVHDSIRRCAEVSSRLQDNPLAALHAVPLLRGNFSQPQSLCAYKIEQPTP